MRQNATVAVPRADKGSFPYSLYVMGFTRGVPRQDDRFIYFEFWGDSVIALFYRFDSFRRGYIATSWRDWRDGEPSALPGVDKDLRILCSVRAASCDRLKSCVKALTQGGNQDVFTYPHVFWYKVAAFIKRPKDIKAGAELLKALYRNV